MGSASDTGAEQPGGGEGTAPAQRLDAAKLLPFVIDRINQAVPGTLTVHYKRRDVRIEMPGDVALRAMVALRRGRPDGLDDPIDIARTCALDGYVGLSTRGVLAVTWQPAVDAEALVDPKLLTVYDALTAPEEADEAAGPAEPAAD